MVNYSFFFWLPFYLHNNFHWEEAVADALSVWYDWGGILAAVLAGVLSVSYIVYVFFGLNISLHKRTFILETAASLLSELKLCMIYSSTECFGSFDRTNVDLGHQLL